MTNTLKKLQLAGAVALLCSPLLVQAKAVPTVDADINNVARLNEIVQAGYGANYKARIKIDKNAYTYANKIVFKTDDAISPAGLIGSELFKVPLTPSMGWNDIATNPDISACSATVTTNCLTYATDIDKRSFGWGHSANWYLIDLNALVASVKGVSVHITVERYDDGIATETTTSSTGVVTTLANDDDLIPALTVWQGNQDNGTHSHWFPNKHQATAKFDGSAGTTFWGRKLSKPEWVVSKKLTYSLKGVNSGMVGWDTAYTTAAQKTATVEGEVLLDKKDPSKNFLTVALGGDNHNVAGKHSANYKLTVEVHKIGM
ncbi:MAG: hypothetical protein NTV43_05020 [Methylococcales bacterium]|nr:hypothetical protein [Methylococcales bacterium]